MFRIATKLALRPTGIYCYRPHAHYPCRAITVSTPLQKKQVNPKGKTASLEATTEEDTVSTHKRQTTNHKYWTSYSKVSILDVEKRLGINFVDFAKVGIPVSKILAEAKGEIERLTNEQVHKTKEMVFESIVRCIKGEGFPTEFDPDFKEVNVNDLVLFIKFWPLAPMRSIPTNS
ncbi:hypothetical protein HOY82DRAFT_534462 [Tuber indicum]|nr:hypothetical protein HOY82DRAFT_534462 [Tuber indicum]